MPDPQSIEVVIATPPSVINVTVDESANQGPEGPQGEPGTPGSDGPSAYEVAVVNGFVGNEAAWLLSLKGVKGDKGDTGDQGPAGADGSDGAQGPAGDDGADGAPGAPGSPGAPGADGDDGLSAYEVAVANGFVGNQTAWLLSLKGAKGDTGDQGPAGADGADGSDGAPGAPGTPGADGDDGAPGADGDDGLSAYEVAVANGFVGNQTAWLLSLKGATGDQGPAGADGSDGADGADGAPGPVRHLYTWHMSGAVGTKTGQAKFLPKVAGEILRIWLTLGTAGSTTTTVDFNKNGTTLFSTGKPNLTSSQTVSSEFTPSSPTFDNDDYFTVDIDAAGTSAADILVHLEYEETV